MAAFFSILIALLIVAAFVSRLSVRCVTRVGLVLLVAVVLVVPVIFYFLAMRFEWMSQDASATVLGYVGAVLGGLLTLAGVRWTIGYEKGVRKEDMRLQYRPLLAPKVVESRSRTDMLAVELVTLFNHPAFNDVNPCYEGPCISLHNVGRGEIMSLRLEMKSCECVYAGPNVSLNPEALLMFEDISRVIPVGDSIDIVVAMPSLVDESLSRGSNGVWGRFRYIIDISMKGSFAGESECYRLEFYVEERFDARNHQREIKLAPMGEISVHNPR